MLSESVVMVLVDGPVWLSDCRLDGLLRVVGAAPCVGSQDAYSGMEFAVSGNRQSLVLRSAGPQTSFQSQGSTG